MGKKKMDINYACSKSWDSMSEVNGLSRLCSGCNSNVSDYTKLEINGNETGCGHFEASQLSTVLNSFFVPKVGLYSMTLLAVIGISSVQQKLFSQSSNTETIIKIAPFKISGIIKGKDSKEPLPFVNVSLFENETEISSTHSDFDGVFKFSIDTTLHNLEDLRVVFNYIGYSQDTIKCNNKGFILGKEKLFIELESNFDGLNVDTVIYMVNGRIAHPDKILTPSEMDSMYENMAPR